MALVYPQILHAYRNDKFTGYVPSPEDGERALRLAGRLLHEPEAGRGGGRNDLREGGISTGLLIAIGAVVVVAIVAFIADGPAAPRGGRGLEQAESGSGGRGGIAAVLRSARCCTRSARLLFVLAFNFFLFRLVGDPVKLLTRSSIHLDPKEQAALREELGIGDPLPSQFVNYIGDTLTGELGISFSSGTTGHRR